MIKLTFVPEMAPGDLAPANLLLALRKMHAHVPIAELFVDWKAPTSRYLYRITAADARVWKQYLYPAPNPDNVGMTFDVPDVWQMHEFVPHREVRDVVLAILTKYPATEMIKYEVT